MAAQQILLFGDQADAPIPMIRRLQQKSGQSKNLDNFLQSAVDNVQLEVAKLTSAEQDTIGSFQSVQDLTTALVDKTDRHGIAQMVLVFIARVGELILCVLLFTKKALIQADTTASGTQRAIQPC
jgi:hypothetical protein